MFIILLKVKKILSHYVKRLRVNKKNMQAYRYSTKKSPYYNHFGAFAPKKDQANIA